MSYGRCHAQRESSSRTFNILKRPMARENVLNTTKGDLRNDTNTYD
jgi:hypothetical protein